jgi:hypothetical protein
MPPVNTRIFFELLAREAPAVEFETPIDEARAAGASHAALAATSTRRSRPSCAGPGSC